MSSAAFSGLIPLTVRGLQQPDVTNVGDVNKIRDDDMQMYSNSNPATNTPPLRSFYPHTTVAAPLQPVSPYATASLLQNNAAPMSESSSSPSHVLPSTCAHAGVLAGGAFLGQSSAFRPVREAGARCNELSNSDSNNETRSNAGEFGASQSSTLPLQPLPQ